LRQRELPDRLMAAMNQVGGMAAAVSAHEVPHLCLTGADRAWNAAYSLSPA
jgi:hypothetical protein